MGLDKLNRIPTSRFPLACRANPLIPVPGSKLFRPQRKYHEIQCLPFVSQRQEDEEGHSCWCFERPGSLVVQAELGKALGAAYFLFVSRNGDDTLPLCQSIDAMQSVKDEDGRDHVAQNFFVYIGKVLQDFGTYVSAQDIEEHLAAVIAEDRTCYEPQDLVEVGA